MRTGLVCGLLALVPALLAGPAVGETERAKAHVAVVAPLPPSRPVRLPTAPEPADVTGAIAPPVQPRRAVTPIVETPHDLPVATRARMHECGARWQQMKTSGAAADRTWHVFAVSCLVSQQP